MKATLDEAGRIQLPDSVCAQLGLKPGDDVIFEERNGHWIIETSREASGLCWEGNVLVHRGRGAALADDVLSDLRRERLVDVEGRTG